MVIIARTPFTLSAPIIVVTVPALRGRIRARVHRAARARSRASLRCGLVVEHEAARIEGLCELDKPAPQLLDRRLRLLHGGQALCFRMSASFSSTRFIEDRLTLRPVRRWNSQAISWSVRSAFSATTARTTLYWFGPRGGFRPPPGCRSSDPGALQPHPPANRRLADL
jgi:hypothetical protein